MADQNITALPVTTAPAESDQFLVVGAAEEKLIDYNKLADAILTKLTSKKYTLNQGSQTLIAAINELNSKMINGKSYTSLDDIPVQSHGTYVLSEAIRPDPDASIYMGFCYGRATTKALVLIRPYTRNIHVNAYAQDSNWKGWKTYS